MNLNAILTATPVTVPSAAVSVRANPPYDAPRKDSTIGPLTLHVNAGGPERAIDTAYIADEKVPKFSTFAT